ncbi:hypothetical protein HU200_066759 [Digitaria exilis]|uniref:Uncharacterized protein n=1 Tax=Digitaria exilis TaxID=1010633 RepID=A0A834ZXP6_9POAL|nr:hypothetical protein HU200_066759 [Digitaria exilis]
MCMEGGRMRRGGNKKQQAEQKASRQPQRGLGVAQLEKIRLHNQMMAAYRSGAGLHQDAVRPQHHHLQVPGASSSFQPYGGLTPVLLQNCLEETERGIVAVHYQLPPFASSPPPPSLFAHDVRDSSGHRLGQPPPTSPPQQQQQQHYWISCTSDGPSSRSGHGAGAAEELDLELRL